VHGTECFHLGFHVFKLFQTLNASRVIEKLIMDVEIERQETRVLQGDSVDWSDRIVMNLLNLPASAFVMLPKAF